MKSLDSKTQFARKPAPFGSIRKVPPFEGQRWPTYQRRAIQTNRRDWTHEDVDRLVTMLDAGHDYDHCARQLRRTRVAIVVKTKRLRCTMTKRPTVLTARDVARLIGKGCSKSVTWWIDAGWIKARAADMRGRRIWRVCWDDLIVFLRDPRYWMTWDAARITDPELRAEMLALRVDAPRWLTIGEVARRYCVISNTVWQWIEKGFLPAMRYGNWYIREDALLGWMPPCERSKAGIPKAMGRAVVGNSMIVAMPL
jgi:helix-turn-helix protein